MFTPSQLAVCPKKHAPEVKRNATLRVISWEYDGTFM